ncbi:leucyl aminopeptidase [Nitratireductor pacificus]|uniref:Probable cytosol aminopeptidase n=1 Tax=Nitratireductor pacificus pht-3B TaxID=391937 RepID=K2LRE3_9HYPH|nr:leucyl aminopeptidase [Nitratireductor pacificus]EKF20324.1 multifunctional aminopeptidase A [Nitratireductor pacificus pht-3B]
MTDRPTVAFAKFAMPKKGSVIVLASEGGGLGAHAKGCDPDGILPRAFEVTRFGGKLAKGVEVLAPAGTAFDRLAAVGAGKAGTREEASWLKIGGAVLAAAKSAGEVTVVADLDDGDPTPEEVASLALGMLLRAYAFDKYKTTSRENGEEKPADKVKITVQCADPAAAKKAFARAEAIAGGVLLARDLVNEPANVLGPVEFAAKAKELEKLGAKVEVLTEKEMKKLGMGALLGVAQGSVRPPRLAIIEWSGGKAKEKPVSFVGKGVVFDTGGISIKPAGGMEDMKGDMGGAAAVVGVMHALAARKAKVNAIGMIGLVENMPDGNAQRPGDIVTSMSGQTIEVINTDAEGRLVLADLLWYCNDRFKPQFMVNLATLTGAIMVALGHHHAGLFSNDDALAERLTAAGLSTDEKLWRMPLGTEYDKLIDSKNADMKNSAGRMAGSITAAQFLKRFVKETPWAHLDVAGTAMGAPASEINRSWGSGFGVRLLDRLVADHYEN